MISNLPSKRGAKYMCVSLAARGEARVQTVVPYDSITLTLNKKNSIKYPVRLLHTHSLQLIFFYDSS